MIINKNTIEEMANRIDKLLVEKLDSHDFSLIYNGEAHRYEYHFSDNSYTKGHKPCVPYEFCEGFTQEKFILGIAFDGEVYQMFNYYEHGDVLEEFDEILNEYDCYIEYWDSTRAYVVFDGNDEDLQIEPNNKVPEPEIVLYKPANAPTSEIADIMAEWYNRSKETKDGGGCVIGAGMHFELNGHRYNMLPQSPWQGEFSWTAHIDWVKKELKKVGAINVRWDYGILD